MKMDRLEQLKALCDDAEKHVEMLFLESDRLNEQIRCAQIHLDELWERYLHDYEEEYGEPYQPYDPNYEARAMGLTAL